MKVIGYLRVSTQGQADEGISLEAQEAKIRAWADLNGAESTRVYQDNGVSGGRMNRPGLQAALVAAGRNDALVVYSLSRLSRSTVDTMNIAKILERRGIELVSLTEKIDTTSAAGKMVFRLLAVLGEFERDQISERTKAAVAYKKSRGEHLGGPYPPFGHKVKDGMLVPVPEEQVTIRLVHKWKRDGFSLMGIARKLEARGVRRKAGGRNWCKTSVTRLLARTVAQEVKTKGGVKNEKNQSSQR